MCIVCKHVALGVCSCIDMYACLWTCECLRLILGSWGEEGLWPAELPANHVESSRVPTRWVITCTRMGCCWHSCLSSCPCSKLSSPMLRYLGLETQNWFTKLDSYLGLPSEYSLFRISRAYSLLPKDSLTQHIQAVHGNCSLLLALQ